MKPKLFLWVIVLLVFSSSTFAMQSGSSHVLEEYFDSTNNLSCTGTTAVAGGVLTINPVASGARCTYINAIPNITTNTKNITIRMGIKVKRLGTGGILGMWFGTENLTNPASGSVATDSGFKYQLVNRSSGTNEINIEDSETGGGANGWRKTPFNPNDATAFHNLSLVLLKNNSGLMYRDNTFIDNFNLSTPCSAGDNNCDNISSVIFGNAGANSINIEWDFLIVWNGSINDEWNVPSTPSSSSPNLTLTANDYFDNSALYNITATLQQGSNLYNYSTINGSLLVNDRTNGVYNLTVRVNDSGGYFSQTWNNFNVSSNTFNARMYQSILYVNATEIISQNWIQNLGAKANSSSINLSNSTGYSTLFLKAGYYNLTVNSTPYFTKSSNVSIRPLESNYYTMSLGNTRINIAAKYIFSGDTIINFTAGIRGLNVSYEESGTTTNGNVTFDVINGNYTINVSGSSLANAFTNVTLNSGITNYTFYVYTIGSIFIQTFLEGTTTLLSGTNVKASFSSDVNVFNQSTLNGSIYAEMVTPTTYSIIMSSAGYTTRQYFVTLQPNENVYLKTYLANATGYTDITFTLKDFTTTATLSNVLTQVYERIGINYTLLTEKYTDVIGQSIFSLDQSKEYRFIMSKDGYITNNFLLTPTETNYEIKLQSELSQTTLPVSTAINYHFEPRTPNLQNKTLYDFQFSLTSDYWTLDTCVFTLRNESQTLIQNITSFDSDSCDITISYNTNNQDKIIAYAWVQLNGTNQSYFQSYEIIYSYQGRYSMKTWIDDINNFTDAGFTPFTRAILGFLLIFGIVAYLANEGIGISNPEEMVVAIIILTWAISYIGWFNLSLDTIPSNIGGSEGSIWKTWIQKYAIALLTTLMGGTFLADRHLR